MKLTRIFSMVVVALTLAVVGCKKGESVDTSPIENAFASAEAATKSAADKAVAAIKSADYAGALTELKTLAEKGKLTPEQEQAIKDVMAKVQQFVTDAANKAAGEANKAVGDLQNSLKK